MTINDLLSFDFLSFDAIFIFRFSQPLSLYMIPLSSDLLIIDSIRVVLDYTDISGMSTDRTGLPYLIRERELCSIPLVFQVHHAVHGSCPLGFLGACASCFAAYAKKLGHLPCSLHVLHLEMIGANHWSLASPSWRAKYRTSANGSASPFFLSSTSHLGSALLYPAWVHYKRRSLFIFRIN